MNDKFSPFGNDLFGAPIEQGGGAVAERFTFPPFTVLSSRDGAWQERKRAWLAHGIKSEVGREGLGDTCFSGADYVSGGDTYAGDSGSVFDPVLCEVMYSWFCRPGGWVLDPFAGGSVRGMVAGLMGYAYDGIELRPEQVSANREQRASICPEAAVKYTQGDSYTVLDDAFVTGQAYDFVFTCPPYGDLEVYSDDPNDLSNLSYDGFVYALCAILYKAYTKLKDDTFMGVVFGDYRDKRTGMLRGATSDLVCGLRSRGVPLYNQAVLVTPTGTLPVRITRQFDAGRKMGKGHQDVLVFAKGDPKAATMKITGGRRPC